MNKIASLTFGNDSNCNEIFDVLEKTLSNPSECSVLTLHKTIRSVHHIIIYGHERVIHLIQQRLRHHIGRLTSYNTALQQQQSKFALGGAVDKGEPVRTAASELYNNILSKPMAHIQKLRNESADPNSLVPIGQKNDTLGYQSEEYLSKPESERIAANLEKTKSNLSGNAGYGAGVHLRRDANGKVIVGAAHSMEEMMQLAAMKDKKFSSFSDDPSKQQNKTKSGGNKSLDSDYTRQMMAPDLLDLDFQGGNAKTSNDDPFSSASNEMRLQEELEKHKKELEELRKQVQQPPQQTVPSQQSVSSEPKPDVTQPKSAADVISSLDNLEPYNNNFNNPMMAPAPGYGAPMPTMQQPPLNNSLGGSSSFMTPAPGYNAPQPQMQQPQLNMAGSAPIMAPAPSYNAPQPQMNNNSNETPNIAFDSTPEANFQFQVPMGGSEVMGGGMSAPKRNLHSGESSGLGDIPLPPPDMPPPPPPPAPAEAPTTNRNPPSNVSYNVKEDDVSSLHSATNQQSQQQSQQMMPMAQQQMMPMQSQMMTPQNQMMPQQNMISQQQMTPQQQMMMMSNQPQMMNPQMMNPQMMMMNPMMNNQMMMNNQQQQQMMMMNNNSMYMQSNNTQQPQQNSMYMSNQQPQQMMMNPMMNNPNMMGNNPQQQMMMNPMMMNNPNMGMNNQQQQQSYQQQQQYPF